MPVVTMRCGSCQTAGQSTSQSSICCGNAPVQPNSFARCDFARAGGFRRCLKSSRAPVTTLVAKVFSGHPGNRSPGSPFTRAQPQPGPVAASAEVGSKKSAWKSLLKDKITKFDQLEGDDFRHPLDRQNTSFMKSIPGLELVAKNFMGPVAEQVLLLENISSSIKVGPEQLPTIHKLLVDAAFCLQMDSPELYVRQNPVPNAYTLAIAGRKPFIVVHTALLELLTPQELQAVIAHELGHLKCDHGLWLTVANVLASGTVSVLPVVTAMVEEALMRWLRAAELTCDRAALLVAQDASIVVSALMKLAGGSPSFANELNVDAFLQQARAYEEATTSMLGWYLRNAQTRALSHPLPVLRAREIDRWAQSAEYKSLLSKNRGNRHIVNDYAGPLPQTVANASPTYFGPRR